MPMMYAAIESQSIHVSLSCFSGTVTAHLQRYRGENAGAARPRLRQRVKSGSRTAASLDSLHVGRAGVFCAARGTRVQCRLAKLHFMVWQVVGPCDRACSRNRLSQVASSGSGHCPPPQTAPKSQKWKPHCGLSGLSSCGSRAGVFCAASTVRIRARLLKNNFWDQCCAFSCRYRRETRFPSGRRESIRQNDRR